MSRLVKSRSAPRARSMSPAIYPEDRTRLAGLSAEETRIVFAGRLIMESIRARSVPNLKRGVNEMTARTWTVRIAAMAFVALPLPLPLPTPSLPLAVPSANIAVSPLLLDAPSVPALNTPGNQAAPTSVAPQGGGGSANHTAPPTDNQNRGIPIPFTPIYVSSPFDIALVGALVTLPLLFGIWLLLFGRTFNEARRARDG